MQSVCIFLSLYNLQYIKNTLFFIYSQGLSLWYIEMATESQKLQTELSPIDINTSLDNCVFFLYSGPVKFAYLENET